jgi:beta-mannosidase
MAYLSQLAQRDALQIAIESHRKNSRFCMGTLYWQLNDAWDGASWSTIEHNGTYKAAHYHLKRLYAPEIVLTEQVGDSIQVYFQTDRMDGAAGIFKAEIMDFKGRILSSYERPVNAGYLTAQLIYQQDVSKLVSGNAPGDYFLRNSITVMDTLLAENIHFFKKPVELNLPEASISMVCEKSGSNIKVTLTSSVLAKDVFVNCEKCNANFSDNFFTLLPQVPKTIFIVGESLEAVEASKIIYQKN